MTELSVVITVMNEEDNINPMVDAVESALEGINFELIFVDDGSTDATRQKIKQRANDHVILVELRKNYGQSTAMTAGIDHATGRYVALLDGDLQNDPTDIPSMLKLLKNEDWDVVAGNRKNRQDGFILRKIPSKIANYLIRRWTKVFIKDYGCTLKILGHDIWGKPLLILGLIFLLGGIQLITIGILAEINVRTYFESSNKKTYQVRRIVGGQHPTTDTPASATASDVSLRTGVLLPSNTQQ
jgi:glycosyltransferase involved in cell wall biosynthesis